MRSAKTVALGCVIAMTAGGVAAAGVRDGSMRDAVGDGGGPSQDITSIQAFFHDKGGFYARTTLGARPSGAERINLIVEYGRRDGKTCAGNTRLTTATSNGHGDAKLTYGKDAKVAPALGTDSPDGLVVRLRARLPADLGAKTFDCVTVALRPLDEPEGAAIDVAGPLFLNPEHKPCRLIERKAARKRCLNRN